VSLLRTTTQVLFTGVALRRRPYTGANENIGDRPAQKSVVASLQSAAADAGDDLSGGVRASALLP
jgi:hypothetical protein